MLVQFVAKEKFQRRGSIYWIYTCYIMPFPQKIITISRLDAYNERKHKNVSSRGCCNACVTLDVLFPCKSAYSMVLPPTPSCGWMCYCRKLTLTTPKVWLIDYLWKNFSRNSLNDMSHLVLFKPHKGNIIISTMIRLQFRKLKYQRFHKQKSVYHWCQC